MTLNQVLQKIQAICVAHKMVRSFYQGMETDLLTDKTTKFPAVFLQDNGGTISIKGQSATFGWKIFFMDLVHVSEETKLNINDVQSDMVGIAMDIMAQLARSENKWILSPDNSIQLLDEEYENDNVSGVVVDFSIRFAYDQNICSIPTIFSDYTPTDTNLEAFDLEYIADGTEGTTLVIPAIIGKKILLLTRENSLLYKIDSNPDSTEYVWDNNVITLGLPTISGQRFLILYRNY